eukprot:scaffold17.g473.t1
MTGLLGWVCCGRESAPDDGSSTSGGHKRRRRRKHIHASSAAGGLPNIIVRHSGTWDGQLRHGGTGPAPISPASARSSVLSEGEYFDAHSDMLPAEGGSSPHELSDQHSGLLDRLTSWWEHRHHTEPGNEQQQRQRARSFSPTGSLHTDQHHRSTVVEDGEEPARVGCVSLFTATQVVIAQRRFLSHVRPRAGSSFSRQAELDDGTACCSWEPADATTFLIRSAQYMKTKVKVASAPPIYRVLGVDMYSFDSKLFHVAQHVELPKPPQLGPAAAALPPDQQLPPLLIFNVQLPTYAPSLFGSTDGPGHSLIYYLGLEEGWEPQRVENQAALGLLQRFVHNKREHDGQPTRDRMKLIPRVVNVEEWAEKGPLSGYEHRLLANYNDKPLLTRPQQRFYRGDGYLEVDLDVHNYAYIARRAFHGFMGRLAPVVFENAFVIQGNRQEELPEVVLGAVRMYRVDFTRSRPFPTESLARLGNGQGPPHDGDAAQ